jgi:hypothetical protein
LGRFDYFETNDGAGNAQAKVQQRVDGRLDDFLAIEVDAIAGLEVFDPPLAIVIRNFDVLAADVFVFDGNLARVGAADAEGGGELAENRGYDVANGDAKSLGVGRRFHGRVSRTRNLILAKVSARDEIDGLVGSSLGDR